MIYLIILIGIIALDHITKIFVNVQGPMWEIPIIEDIFSLSYAKNPGAALGFLSDKEWGQTFFFILTCVILPVLYIIFLKLGKNRKWLKTALILIIGGTIGNFIDRLVFKEVTDFINVHFFSVFNVADISLTVGAIMLAVWFVFLDDEALIPLKKKKDNG